MPRKKLRRLRRRAKLFRYGFARIARISQGFSALAEAGVLFLEWIGKITKDEEVLGQPGGSRSAGRSSGRGRQLRTGACIFVNWRRANCAGDRARSHGWSD